MKKILLAEDDSTMVSLLQTLLKLEGYETVALDIDADIPAAVLKEQPDVLLMDVHLGEQSGMEVVELIRNNPRLSGVRVVMISGLDMKDECLQHGADAFLPKPFMPADLLNALKRNNDSA